MKPHAYLVNDSRGGVVDEAALSTALVEGWIAGAAMDVFATEPLPVGHQLLSVPGLVVSPHTAGYSDTALLEITTQCARSVLKALEFSFAKD
jgi:phosphoglycerate dehydrogenase-like enzyme